jgi:sugar/nucleoside kinase (ribokinase family)
VTAQYDVYAYGVIASSTLHLLEMPFPAADGYAELGRTYPMTGGEALNSAIVLSRLGLSVKLDGNWLGDTDEGRRLHETVTGFGIDATRLVFDEAGPGAREIVISDSESRTVFGNYIALLTSGRKWNIPRESDIADASLVCVDPPFGDESLLTARLAAEHGVPFVSIDCPFDSPLATEAAAVVISGEYRRRDYPDADVEELFEEYQSRAAGLVVLTRGEMPILYGRRGRAQRSLEPFPVAVADTAGAGDSFRAGLIYGMLAGWDDSESVRYAAAVAAMVCSRFPGVLNSPATTEVDAFLARLGAPATP